MSGGGCVGADRRSRGCGGYHVYVEVKLGEVLALLFGVQA